MGQVRSFHSSSKCESEKWRENMRRFNFFQLTTKTKESMNFNELSSSTPRFRSHRIFSSRWENARKLCTETCSCWLCIFQGKTHEIHIDVSHKLVLMKAIYLWSALKIWKMIFEGGFTLIVLKACFSIKWQQEIWTVKFPTSYDSGTWITAAQCWSFHGCMTGALAARNIYLKPNAQLFVQIDRIAIRPPGCTSRNIMKKFLRFWRNEEAVSVWPILICVRTHHSNAQSWCEISLFHSIHYFLIKFFPPKRLQFWSIPPSFVSDQSQFVNFFHESHDDIDRKNKTKAHSHHLSIQLAANFNNWIIECREETVRMSMFQINDRHTFTFTRMIITNFLIKIFRNFRRPLFAEHPALATVRCAVENVRNQRVK